MEDLDFEFEHLPGTSPPSSQILTQFLKEEDPELEELNDRMLLLGPRLPAPVMPVSAPQTEEEWLMWKAMRDGLFPPSREPFEDILDFEQFKEVVEREKKKYKREDLKLYYLHLKTRTGYDAIWTYCVQCKRSKEEKGVKKMVLTRGKMHKSVYYRLKDFDNHHDHTYYNSNYKQGRKTSSLVTLIKKDLAAASGNTHLAEFKQQLAEKYRISHHQIRTLLYRIKRQSVHLKQIVDLARMTRLQLWFRNSIEEPYLDTAQAPQQLRDEPALLMFAPEEASVRFKKNGEVCYLMFIDLGLPASKRGKRWDVLFLSGLALNYLYEPFAFALLDKDYRNAEHVAPLVAKMFELLGGVPRVLFTPSQDSYDELVVRLANDHAYRGLHLYDPLIELDRIGASLDNYEDLAHFRSVLLSKSKVDFLANLNQLMLKCPPSASIRYNLNRVLRHRHKLCFGCLETYQHVGAFYEHSANKIIFDIVRENFIKYRIR
jgi:hypothetical protein